jgi:hypothetical protein
MGMTNMETALGTLINTLNPYSNPKCEPLGDLLQRTPQQRMHFAVAPPGLGEAADDAKRLAQIAVEIDNYQGGEWTFMGQMYKIKRALLIPYRYQVMGGENSNKPSGVWASGNLLIGYTGANGG